MIYSKTIPNFNIYYCSQSIINFEGGFMDTLKSIHNYQKHFCLQLEMIGKLGGSIILHSHFAI